MKIKDIKKLIKESSSTTHVAGRVVDDGPNFVYSDYEEYRKEADERAEQIGLKVIDDLMDKKKVTSSEPHEKMGNDGAEIKPIDKEAMRRLVKLVGYKVVEKYLQEVAGEEIDKFLEDYDLEYDEHVYIEE